MNQSNFLQNPYFRQPQTITDNPAGFQKIIYLFTVLESKFQCSILVDQSHRCNHCFGKKAQSLPILFIL